MRPPAAAAGAAAAAAASGEPSGKNTMAELVPELGPGVAPDSMPSADTLSSTGPPARVAVMRRSALKGWNWACVWTWAQGGGLFGGDDLNGGCSF